MKRLFWRTIVLAGLLLAWGHPQAIAQLLLEPTLDEAYQDNRAPASEADLPLLNPQAQPVNRPPANPQLDVAPPRAATGPAYLGVTFDMQYRNAAVVRTVNPGSPAEQAGLQPGDAIESLQGQPINNYRDVQEIVARMRSGDVLQIEFSRRITARTQAALDIVPAASQRSVGYPPDFPQNSPNRATSATPRSYRNAPPQNQNRAAPNDQRDDFRGRGLIFRRR